MNNLNLFFLVIAVMAMATCGKKTDTAKMIELQKELTAKWDIAIDAGDVEALTSLFDENAVRMNQHEPILKGKEAIRKSLQTRFEKYSSNEEEKIQNVIVSGDHTIVWGSYKGDYKYYSHDSIIHSEGKWVNIRKRQADGSWKTIIDIWNSDSPLMISNQ